MDASNQSLDRRFFIQGSLSLCASAVLTACNKQSHIKTSISGPDVTRGHGDFSNHTPDIHPTILDVAILGGGVSGLSAARELARQKILNVKLFELESIVGGNARSGEFQGKSYPLGAHYLPIPTSKQHDLLEFLSQANVIKGFGPRGEPQFEERYLLHAPGERLFQWGRWHASIIPSWGQTKDEKRQFEKFWSLLSQIDRDTRGEEFVLPLRQSARKMLPKLDRVTMVQFLNEQGLTCNPLHWYVDYCCRDDFGTSIHEVSAWAGIHYFLARRGRESDKNTLLAWPEGNGFLVSALRRGIPSGQIISNSVVTKVEKKDLVHTTVWHADQNRLVTYRSRSAIAALPTHVRKKIGIATHQVAHAPWVTATLALRDLPASGNQPLSWDNVSYHSNSLGYIYNGHQELAMPKPPYMVTYYSALTGDPNYERQLLAMQNSQDWSRRIFADLSPMHPDLEHLTDEMRVWLWPHAMVKPTPGMLSQLSPVHRQNWPILNAHCDDSGMSLFEEAFDQGQHAARFAAKNLHNIQGRRHV